VGIPFLGNAGKTSSPIKQVLSSIAGDTDILADDVIQKMYNLYISSNKSFHTYSFANKNVIPSTVSITPYDISLQDLCTLKFSNGFILKGAPTLSILDINGVYLPIANAAKDVVIQGIQFTNERGISLIDLHVEMNEIEHKLIPIPVYGFNSDKENILLPFYSPTNEEELTFICVK
jgi:hypothetical protein